MKLSAMEREIATALVQALVEYGLAENLAQYVELSFGERDGPNFLINYRRSKPLTRFQIWMFKICFGIEAKNL